MILLLLCVTSCVIIGKVESIKPYYDIDRAEELFEDFIKTYDKSYSNIEEKQLRFNIFKDNLKTINQQNAMDGATFAVNKFSDITKEEFEKDYMGYRPSLFRDSNCKVVTDADILTVDAPASLNWVEKQKVTKVKDQAYCGSCWAFSTIGNIESQYAIKNNNLKILSEQELLDCSKSNLGCDGGNMVYALQDLINLGGVCSDSTYPYKSRVQKCTFNEKMVEVKLNGCTNYDIKDEVKLKEVLAKNGPVSVALHGKPLHGYERGILTRKDCPVEPLSHAVLIVGYGTENGLDYWLVKNSWGPSWGEKGYFRISRGNNTCGIMNDSIASVEL